MKNIRTRTYQSLIKEEISIGLILQTTSSDIKMVGIQIRSFQNKILNKDRSG